MSYEYTDQDGDKVYIEASSRGGIYIGANAGVTIPTEEVPRAALAMLNAAIKGEYKWQIMDAIESLTDLIVEEEATRILSEAEAEAEAARLADMEAEADRNALEAEAERLWHSRFPYENVRPLSELSRAQQEAWRNVALVARKIQEEKTA